MAALAFCVGAAYWPGIYSASLPKWWAMAVFLAVFGSIDIRRIDPVVAACGAAAVLMAALSLMETPHFYGGLFDFACITVLCGMAVGASALDDVGPVIEAFSWGVAVSVAASVLQVFGWWIAPHHGYAGLYLNSEVMAETSAPLCVWAFWRRRWVLSAIMALSVVLCWSRIGFLVVGAGLLYGLPISRKAKWGIGGALLAGVVAMVVLPHSYKLLSGIMRLIMWGTAVLSITPSGHGLAWWYAAHPFPQEEFAHSDVLQSMVEIGLGAVFFLAIPVMVLRRPAGVAERAAYIGICVEALVSFPFHFPATGFLGAVLTGFLARRGLDAVLPATRCELESGAGIRREVAERGGVAGDGGGRGSDVPLRPAYPQFAADRPAACEGSN